MAFGERIMKFLTNFDHGHSHVSELCDCFARYRKAHIAVAFFKMSGFDALKNSLHAFLKKGGLLQIIVGTDLYVTEPDALKGLYELMKMSPDSILYIKKTQPHTTFHPKLYLFETHEVGKIIIGSANMTKGGLAKNNEISLSAVYKKTSPTWTEAMAVFQTYLSEAVLADELTLGRYKKSFMSQPKGPRASTPSFPTVNPDFNYASLQKRLKQLTANELEDMRAERDIKYKNSKKILNEIANTKGLNAKKFKSLLEKLVNPDGYWRSGYLYRDKNKIIKFYDKFAELVRFIRDNQSQPADYVFSLAMELAKPIEGVGVNYVTEIMASYNRKDFAVLNKNSFTVLTTEGGVGFDHKHHTSFDGEDYANFCAIVKEICQNLGFNNNLEVDSFFNDIYWELKKAR